MRITSLLLILSVSATTMAAPAEKTARLEELFLWKISDELKLNPEQQKKLEDVVHDLSNKKADLASALETSLKTLKEEASPKARKNALRKYRQALTAFQKLPLEEMDRVKAALGEQKLAEYIGAKKDLIEKVKALIVDKVEKSGEPEKTALPAPAVSEKPSVSETK